MDARANTTIRSATIALALVLDGCGGGGGGADPVDAAIETDDATTPTRPYALASAAAQLGLEPQPGIALTSGDLASDVDAVLVHQEFYGLPWDELVSGDDPPAAWQAIMDQQADAAAAVGPVFLSLQLVSGNGRRFLADRTVVAGDSVSGEAGWSAECYDFSTAVDATEMRAAYLAYVDWMVRRFRPRWVNVAIEMNFFASCGEGPWNALVEVERAAYDTVKAIDDAAIVFPSIQIDVLQGYGPDCVGDRDACFDANYALLADVARDRFAVTSFPYLIEELRSPGALPDDWLTRAGDRGGEATVVAETGWLGEPMVVQRADECITAIDASEANQRAWFDHVMATTERAGIELVTWVSDRDVVPTEMMANCPCDFDATWCGFLDAYRQSAGVDPDAQAGAEFALERFGAMGLRRYDGTPRAELLERWQAARARSWSGR